MMKKLMLALALVAPTATFASDIAAGAWEVTGGTNLGYHSTELKAQGQKATTKTTALETGVAYYLTPMIGLGLELSYDQTKTEIPGFGESKDTSYFFGPKLVVDFGVAPQVSIIGDLTVGYTSMDSDGDELSGWGWGLGAGVRYFFSRNVAGDLGLKYQAASLDASGTSVDAADLRIGVALTVLFNNPAPAAH